MTFRPRRTRRGAALLFEALESRTLLSVTAYSLSTLQTFNNVTAKIGLAPDWLSIDGQGNIFGTTSGGGVLGYGTLFEIPAATGKFKVLAQFDGVDGFAPTGHLVIDSLGNIYGAATNGGLNNDGVIYELHAGGESVVDLYDFTTDTGSHPFAGITADNHGNLFGTTYDGGGPNLGTVFEYGTLSKTFTVLHTFSGDNNEGGQSTGSVVLDSAGNLYGTTYAGGADGDGTVFKVFAGSNFYEILASFDGDNGSNPTGTLVRDSAGSLYGVTSNGGAAGNGAAYAIPAGTNEILLRASFDGDTGVRPSGNIVADNHGDLFGTTPSGGSSGNGTAYVLLAGANSITTLATFTSADTGLQPSGGLAMTRYGKVIGTTTNGGTYDDGVLFQLIPASLPAIGWVDNVSSTGVQGWAYDPVAGATSIQVAVYVDGKFVSDAPANLSRPDVVGKTVRGLTILGDLHGFNVDYSSLDLGPGKHTVSVYALSINGGNNPLIRTVNIVTVAPFGFFDAINSGVALGWAYNPSLGTAPATVKILVDGSLLTTTVANVSRPDVNGAVMNGVTVNGADHGFSYSLASVTGAGPHTITLLVTDPGHADIVIGTKSLTLI